MVPYLDVDPARGEQRLLPVVVDAHKWIRPENRVERRHLLAPPGCPVPHFDCFIVPASPDRCPVWKRGGKRSGFSDGRAGS
jgi:hypothetical protein